MRKLSYYVIYRSATDHTPAGIVVRGVDGTEIHGMVWSHREKGWLYDVTLSGEAVNQRDWDELARVTREEAERVTPTVTGGEQLPDDETIWWIFQWKGDPPQNRD